MFLRMLYQQKLPTWAERERGHNDERLSYSSNIGKGDVKTEQRFEDTGRRNVTLSTL